MKNKFAPKPLAFPIHPTTAAYLKKGHPWITEDKFSLQFPRDQIFVTIELPDKSKAQILNDPTHPKIKGRLWTLMGTPLTKGSFNHDLEERISESIEKRKLLSQERNIYYLCFGEADLLPGLFIIRLGDHLLIQISSYFWNKVSRDLIRCVRKIINPKGQIFLQERFDSSNKAIINEKFNPLTTPLAIEVKEFGVRYIVRLGAFYDFGLYPDMAKIRKELSPIFETKKNILNLFCYTGAFSLYAHALSQAKTTNVDLSPQYLSWLQENIALNQFSNEDHALMPQSTIDAMKILNDRGESFDLILCDPPTASSDRKKTTNALQSYDRMLPKISELLTEKGHAIIFLNTQSISMSKFKKQILDIIKDKNLPLKHTSDLFQGEDCPIKSGFPEGRYLKGLVLTQN